jgi:hypothetical protein
MVAQLSDTIASPSGKIALDVVPFVPPLLSQEAICVANRPHLGGYSQVRTLVHSYALAGQELAGKV